MSELLLKEQVLNELYVIQCRPVSTAMKIIRELPTIDLVRCGECIHRHEHEWYNTCDKHIGHGFEDDYFCKDGERNSKNNSNAI